MKTLFRNATIVTLDLHNTVLTGDVLVDDDRIAYVGGEYGGEADKTLDFGKDVLMPSLVNTHTHLAMTIMRSAADDLKLKDWLYRRIFPMEAKLDEGLVRAGVRMGLVELIRGGVTGAVDMYLYPEVVRACMQESGIEGVVCAGDSDADGDTVGRLARQERVLEASTDRIKGMLSFHAEYTCSANYLDGIMSLSQASKTGVVCHNSETLEEVGMCASKHADLSPTMYLHSIGLLDYGGIMAHCVHCDKDDLALLKQNNCAVALNSASNLKLGSGIPNVLAMKEKGLNITLGTDSAASNNKQDLWREMYLSAVLPKGFLNNPTAVNACDALRFATVNGEKAMGMGGGKIAEGETANLIRVGLDAASMTPTNDVASGLVYCGAPTDVKMTMCRGKILYENGLLTNGWDEQLIKKEASAAAIELLRRT